MIQVSKLISYEAYEDEIEKLMKLLHALGIPIPDNAQLLEEAVEAFKFLYYATFAEERSADPTIEKARIHVGLRDLATKINKAWSKAGSEAIRPHLERMVQGAVRMNEKSSILDDAANKTSELYVGCLALGCGWPVSLDDPAGSSGGTNPDVILARCGHRWSIAVKTIHGEPSQTIFGNIAGAARQIERSGTIGIPFINLKNRIDQSALMPEGKVYTEVEEANSTLRDAMVPIIQLLRDDIVDQDWLDTFKDKRARPVVAFMAQAVTSFRDANFKEIFVPIRQVTALTVPPLPKGQTQLHGLDLEALKLVVELNEELQDAPTAIGPP
jgi:hypothetical protein